MQQKSTNHEIKDWSDYIKIKNHCSSENIKKAKRQAPEGGIRYMQYILIWIDWKKNFKDIQMANSIWNHDQAHKASGKCKSKLLWDTKTCTL